MDPKSGFKTSELLALVASILVAALPIVLDKLPPESTWAVVLGVLLTIATYIAGRSYVKGAASRGAALVEASKAVGVPQPDPSKQPSPKG